MKAAVKLLSLIGIQILLVFPTFAQVAAPEPEGFRIGLTGFVVAILVLALGAVAIVLFMRKSPEGKALAKRDRAAKPAQQEANEFVATRSQPSQGSTSKVGAVFISYRRQDSADITGRIGDRLVERIGSEAVYKDVDSIPLGVDFRKHLQASVSQCRVLLAVIGKNWLGTHNDAGNRCLDDPRDYLRIEVETALQRDIPVIPVLVQGASMPREEDLPASLQPLAFRNAVAVRPDPDFRADMDRLINGIQQHLGAER